MILVDTSVWIDFLKGVKRAEPLGALLESQGVLSHPWIFGELMLGDLGKDRAKILKDLAFLPRIPGYAVSELNEFVEQERLFGSGLSLVDVQLLYGVLAGGHQLWTHDQKLYLRAKQYRAHYL